ncbi:TIGR03943 family putative permease subunit [Nakamurella lactea]|uniref:TIGR03943 family putative permease subunit n=1 Tax=Nakamurella lactea TaxID=459515 RepID=UPI000412BB9C|nr:TIGR03943 family protein [Nakamurella lactea]
MNKEAQSIVVTLLGGTLVGITASGRYTSYVKPGFGPLILIGGIVLIVIGVLSLVQIVLGARRESEGTTRPATTAEGGAEVEVDAHGHSHRHSRAPWLILVPSLILVLVAPSALGADAVARNAGSQAIAGMEAAPAAATKYDGYAPNDGSGSAEDSSGRRTMSFDPLPTGPDPVITIKDFVLRTLYDADDSVSTTPVTVVGFIAPAGSGYHGGYTIARLAISCCAADANPIRIHVDGDPPFAVNTWVAAVVTGVSGTGGADNDYVPQARVTNVQQVAQPSDPYEH